MEVGRVNVDSTDRFPLAYSIFFFFWLHRVFVAAHRIFVVARGLVALVACLAWEIPWREEPGRIQSMGSQE